MFRLCDFIYVGIYLCRHITYKQTIRLGHVALLPLVIIVLTFSLCHNLFYQFKIGIRGNRPLGSQWDLCTEHAPYINKNHACCPETTTFQLIKSHNFYIIIIPTQLHTLHTYYKEIAQISMKYRGVCGGGNIGAKYAKPRVYRQVYMDLNLYQISTLWIVCIKNSMQQLRTYLHMFSKNLNNRLVFG